MVGLIELLMAGPFTLFAMACGWFMATGELPHPVRWLTVLVRGEKKKPEPVNAIQDLRDFKKQVRERQAKEWEQAWLEAAPPKPAIRQKFVQTGTMRTGMDSTGRTYQLNDGYYAEDHTEVELWEKNWMPWKRRGK
jgi:hypothetical protein